MASAPYLAPAWLPGGHAQTMWPLLIKGPLPRYRRERWTTPDGDFIDVDWMPSVEGAPCVVLFHGLEGSSRSHYARRLMAGTAARGWNGAVVHFRGCSGEPNRLARAYHSGDSAEIDWILRQMDRLGFAALFVAGVSLGGNALLKWLAEQAAAAGDLVAAAASVSAPLDLAAANRVLSAGFNRVYARHFLRTLIPAAFAKKGKLPPTVDLRRAAAARTLAEFDDAVTAPLHGFAGAADYYARSSAGPRLGTIAVPTLLLHALNDPFLPAAALPRADALPPSIVLETPRHGGHVGFVHGLPPGRVDWMPQRLLDHFAAHLPATAGMR